MININKKILYPSIIVAAVLVGFVGGFYYRGSKLPQVVNRVVLNKDVDKPAGVDFSVFWDVWGLLQEKYVDRKNLNTQSMIYGAIDGMVKAVGDPYTVFFNPKDSEAFSQEISGIFSGIGIEIGIRNNFLTIIAPIKNTPADKAGLLAGDKIVKIGDKLTDGMDTTEAVTLIRGPRGTPVRLQISRGDQNTTKEYTIVRDSIKVPTVSWRMIDGNIAYLELFVFNQNVEADFQKIAKEITRSQADRIILDLRNNPGGLLDSAINIASYFLDSNALVTKEVFADGREDAYNSSSNGQLKKYPLIILTNEGSASASEILAGALKDNRRVAIVGDKTFGKGLVQEVDELPGKASVKITIAKWYTPSGLSINENGIVPDVEIGRSEADINADKDPQLDKAVELIKNLK